MAIIFLHLHSDFVSAFEISLDGRSAFASASMSKVVSGDRRVVLFAKVILLVNYVRLSIRWEYLHRVLLPGSLNTPMLIRAVRTN